MSARPEDQRHAAREGTESTGERELPLVFDAFNRPLSRRSVLALLGTSATAAFLAACGSSAASPSAAAPTTSAAPSTPAAPTASAAPTPGASAVASATPAASAGGRSKTVVIGNGEGDAEHLDMLLTPAFVTRQNAGPVHGFLTKLEVDGSISPELATAWEVVDPTHIRFTIREGVKFHNGRALVAEDVKKTYDHILKEATGSTFRGSLDPVLSGWETPDATTAIAVLKQPFPAFIALASQIPIYPMEVVEQQGDMKTNPVGCGPFVFKEWQKDNFSEFVRNPDYWDPDLPKIDTLRILPRSEAASLLNGFLADETDVITVYRFTDKSAIEGANGQTQQIFLFGFQFVIMDVNTPPFDNKAFRQAMEKGIDRAALATVAQGPGTPVADMLIPKSSPLYPGDYTWQRDVEGAKALLAQSGVDLSQEINVMLVDLPFARPYGPVMQANFEEPGLRAKVDIRSVADFIKLAYTDKKYQIAITGDASPPDPSLFVNRYLTTGGSTNVTNYSNPQVDDLLTRAGTTYDDAERKSLYSQAMKLVVDDAPAFPAFENVVTTAWKNHITGWGVKSNDDFYVLELDTSKA